MAPFEALYRRRCRSPIGWSKPDEARLYGTDLVRDALEKIVRTSTAGSADQTPAPPARSTRGRGRERGAAKAPARASIEEPLVAPVGGSYLRRLYVSRPVHSTLPSSSSSLATPRFQVAHYALPLSSALTARDVFSVVLGGFETRVDLLLLSMVDFDVILDMYWLSPYHSILDCHAKTVTLVMPGLPQLEWRGTLDYVPSRVVSLLKAQQMVGKGCNAYLAFVRDVSVDTPTVESVPVVRYYPDVFPVDLFGHAA
ncbi:uncharacterized protein [Nicotiana tomentosiformis]|uniref:uncharacterized protein n=1 Tax=Nicotiana tomentosiformis TaxID=4098 RepID=UPI00388C7D2D